MASMKAYLASTDWSDYALIVFAETAGKARQAALGEDEVEDASYTEIRVRRKPEFDKLYKQGKRRLDWEIDEDRIALVRDGGFYCVEVEEWECRACCAKEYCDTWKELEEG